MWQVERGLWVSLEHRRESRKTGRGRGRGRQTLESLLEGGVEAGGARVGRSSQEGCLPDSVCSSDTWRLCP